MRHILLASVLFLWLGLCGTAGAQNWYEQQLRSDSSRVALAFAGGGARGLAHIGVLKWFREHDMPVDLVTGTSMGALVGGLFSAGWSDTELDSLVRAIPWMDTFSEHPRHNQLIGLARFADARAHLNFRIVGGKIKPPSGLVSGHKVELLLSDLTMGVHHIHDFRKLPRAFGCVATDLETGEPHYLVRGSLALALRASMSLPSIFDPMLLDDRLLVDGGLVENLPVELAWRMGATAVVAVQLDMNLRSRDELDNLLAVAEQSVNVIGRLRENELSLRADVVLKVVNSDTDLLGFDQIPAIIAAGYAAAEAKADELLHLRDLVGRGFKEYHKPILPDSLELRELAVGAGCVYEAGDLARVLKLKKGMRIGTLDLQRKANSLVYSGHATKASYSFVPLPGKTDSLWAGRAEFQVQSQRPSSLGLNIAYSESEQLILGLSMDIVGPTGPSSLLRLSSELEGRKELKAEYLLANVTHSGAFAYLQSYWRDRELRYENENGRLEFEYHDQFWSNQAALGFNLRKGALLLGGLFRDHRILKSSNTGLPYGKSTSITAGYIAQLWIDTRNSLYFPDKGFELFAEYRQNIADLSDNGFMRTLKLRSRFVLGQGPLTLESTLSTVHSFDELSSETDLTQFGGYPWEPGFLEHEVLVENFWSLSIGLRARFSETASLKPFIYLADYSLPDIEGIAPQFQPDQIQGGGLALSINHALLGPISMGYSHTADRGALLFFRAGYLLDH